MILGGAPAQFDLTVYYTAKMASDLFHSAEAYPGTGILPWHRLLLYCMTIELALKASLLNNNNTRQQRHANKALSHRLADIVEAAKDSVPPNLLTDQHLQAISKVSVFFHRKDLEYASIELSEQMVTGRKKLPDIESLRSAALALVDFVEENRHFVDSSTPPKS